MLLARSKILAMFVQGWRFLQSFEVIAHLQLESLDHSDDTGWWLMYLRIFFHPPPSGDDPNPVYDKQCKQYIHNTQLIFLARSLVNFTNSNIMPISYIKIENFRSGPRSARNYQFQNSQVKQVTIRNKADERLFLKYINYIFGVLCIHFVIIG